VALTANFDISVALLLLLGLAGVIFTTTANTLLQLRVPNELRGRVMSVYLLLFLGTTPIGGLLVGTLARSLGVGEALVLCAALCLAGIGAALLYGRTGLIPQPGAESAPAQP
jgi:hypothetical protein